MGSVNARYGNEPGATFYTHISDQYAPFHTKLISATVRDATHVLDPARDDDVVHARGDRQGTHVDGLLA